MQTLDLESRILEVFEIRTEPCRRRRRPALLRRLGRWQKLCRSLETIRHPGRHHSVCRPPSQLSNTPC